jgi:hypothetical protein
MTQNALMSPKIPGRLPRPPPPRESNTPAVPVVGGRLGFGLARINRPARMTGSLYRITRRLQAECLGSRVVWNEGHFGGHTFLAANQLNIFL